MARSSLRAASWPTICSVPPMKTSSETWKWRSAMWVISRETTARPKLSISPIAAWPLIGRRNSAKLCSVRAWSCCQRSISVTRMRPASVRRSPRGRRSNKSAPYSASSLRIWRFTADGDTLSCTAARRIDPTLATRLSHEAAGEIRGMSYKSRRCRIKPRPWSPSVLENCLQRSHEAIQFLFGVVDMDRGAHDVQQAASLEVEARGELRGDRDVDRLLAQLGFQLVMVFAGDGEGHDGALDLAEIGQGDSLHGREPRAQAIGQFAQPRPDRLHAELVGLVGGDLQADDAGEVALPVLEAPRVVAHRVGVVVGPLGGMVVEQQRLDMARRRALGVKEARATGPAQVFAAGHRQEVAADFTHVDRQLADRLAGIEQIEHAGIVGDLADRLGRLHQATLRRHMGDRDQLGALVDGALQGAKVDLAVVVVGHHDDLRARLLGDLQVGDVVRRIFADAGQDAVARLEIEGVEGEVPGPRGVLDEGHFVGLGPDQPGDRGIKALQLVMRLGGSLVAADLGLELQVVQRGVEGALAGERGTGGIEVQDVGAAGRLGTQPGQIEGHVRGSSVV